MKIARNSYTLFIFSILFSACGGSDLQNTSSSSSSDSSEALSVSSAFRNSSLSSVVVSSALSSSSVSCEQAAELGLALFRDNCRACHGGPDDIPSDGTTIWASSGNTVDVFDSGMDGYQPRGSGSPQMLAFNEFIALFMPNMSAPIGNDNNEADYIAAFISSRVNRPWCPGTDWLTPQSSVSSSSIASSVSSSTSSVVEFSGYRQGDLLYSQDFNDNDAAPWQLLSSSGTAVRSGVIRLWKKTNDGNHGIVIKLSGKSDERRYTEPKTLVSEFPNDFTNVVVEFDILFKPYVDPQGRSHAPKGLNFAFDDTYSNDYTHAGHISRVQINPERSDSILFRDDIGGTFGKKKAERVFSGNPAKRNQVIADYYSREQMESKSLRKRKEFSNNTWYNFRVVAFGSRMELWVDRELAGAFDSPGVIDVDEPIRQPRSSMGVSYGRDNVQPRGFDHYKNKIGFTLNGGEVNIDNIKIWGILPD